MSFSTGDLAWAPHGVHWIAVRVIRTNHRTARVALVLEDGRDSAAYNRDVPLLSLQRRDPTLEGADRPKDPYVNQDEGLRPT